MTTIIPDIHGRTFWKEAVNKHPNSHVIFLGDYLDPYPWEGISTPDAIRNLMEIIEFKRSNPDRVTLLIGNHDIHYIDNSLCYGRKDTCFDVQIQSVFTIIGEGCFDMAYALTLDNQDYLFTHAGVTSRWWERHFPDTPMQAAPMAEVLNQRFHQMPVTFIHDVLSEVSFYRGGDYEYSSCVWADMDELDLAQPIPNLYQIVGHTQQESGPIITKDFANLDCRQAFLLLDTGKILYA